MPRKKVFRGRTGCADGGYGNDFFYIKTSHSKMAMHVMPIGLPCMMGGDDYIGDGDGNNYDDIVIGVRWFGWCNLYMWHAVEAFSQELGSVLNEFSPTAAK